MFPNSYFVPTSFILGFWALQSLAAPAGTSIFDAPQPSEGRSLNHLRTVALDPGHGGADLGLKGPDSLLEKDLTLKIAQEATRLLISQLGTQVILTRSQDHSLRAEERVALANGGQADLLISIHMGSSPSPGSRGVGIYTHQPDTQTIPAFTASLNRNSPAEVIPWEETWRRHREQSNRLAHILAETIKETTGLPVLPVRSAALKPLEGANMPAVLLEAGFLTNEEDQQLLAEPKILILLADAIRKACLAYDATLRETPQEPEEPRNP